MDTGTVRHQAKAFEAHNLAYFFLLTVGYKLLAFLFEYLGLIRPLTNWNDPRTILSALLMLPAVIGVPSVVAIVITALTEGKAGVKALWAHFWTRNVSARWLVVALLLLPVLRLIAGILTPLLIVDWRFPLLQEGGIPALLNGVLLGLFAGLLEEFGWRGYALPRLQVKWNALTSSIILGVLTGLWHLSHFYSPGRPFFREALWAWMAWHMLIQVVGYTWIYNNTHGNLLALVLFHMTTSIGAFALNLWVYDGVLLVVAILIVAIFGPRNLVRERPGGTP